jgi:hypothetical protein
MDTHLYTYDNKNNLITATNSYNQSFNGQLEQRIGISEFTYDSNNNRITANYSSKIGLDNNNDGVVESFEDDTNNHSEVYNYDGKNNMISSIGTSNSYYDSNNDGVEELHRYTSTNSHMYDQNNHRISTSYSSQSSWDSDNDGTPDITDDYSNSGLITLSYANNNLTSALSKSTSINYYDSNNDGVEEEHKSINLNKYTYSYDTNNNVIRIDNQSGNDANNDGVIENPSNYNTSYNVTGSAENLATINAMAKKSSYFMEYEYMGMGMTTYDMFW